MTQAKSTEQKLWDLWVEDPGAIYVLFIHFVHNPNPKFKKNRNLIQIEGVSDLIAEKHRVLTNAGLCDQFGVVYFVVQDVLDRGRVFDFEWARCTSSSDQMCMLITPNKTIQEFLDQGKKIKEVKFTPKKNSVQMNVTLLPDDAGLDVPYYRPDVKFVEGLKVKPTIFEVTEGQGEEKDKGLLKRKLTRDLPKSYVPAGIPRETLTKMANLIDENPAVYVTLAYKFLATFPEMANLCAANLKEDPRTAVNLAHMRRLGFLDDARELTPTILSLAKDMFEIHLVGDSKLTIVTRPWLMQFKTTELGGDSSAPASLAFDPRLGDSHNRSNRR